MVEVKEITFLGVILKENKQSNGLNDLVEYPSLSIKFEQFFEHFVATFNSNQHDVKIKFLSPAEQEDLLSYPIPPKVASIRGNLVFSYQGEKEFFEDLKKFDQDYFLIMEYASDPWRQQSRGFFKLYDQEAKLIWHEKIDHVSNYLIYDKASPYLIKNSTIRVPPNDSDHYEEMGVLYGKLGELVGKSLIETLDKAFKTRKN